MELSTPIEQIPRIGPQYQKKLKKLGIKNVKDLIFHFPRRYEDFSNIIPISELKVGKFCCVQGKILEIENTRTWKKRMILTQALVSDKSSTIKTVWFNQPYLTNTLKEGDFVCLAGKVAFGKQGIYLSSPAYEKISLTNNQQPTTYNLIHTGRLVPVYPETEGLSSRWLRAILKPLLIKLRNKIPETIPEKIRKNQRLLAMKEAIWQVHFPDSIDLAEKAEERFSFEELFTIQLFVLKERLKIARGRAFPIPLNLELCRNFLAKLPFKLTDAQKRALWQILKDLEKSQPMNRLLEGDVGSGKTIVATLAILNSARDGFQNAFMAPTEILAEQHFKTIFELLKDYNLKVGLLTSQRTELNGKKFDKKNLLEKVREGQIDILIGTHSLIQAEVTFKKLALVVVDEQHRFGVEQRAKLMKQPTAKNQQLIPHLLSMTATPIPRTLALTIYGDLDLSLIDELPKGRKKIITKIIPAKEREKTYNFIRKEVREGRQVFVICPRIEPTETYNLQLTTNS
jgi:ATP-dependent DNA helicase RecG